MLLWSSHWKLQTEGSAGDPMPSTNINDPNKSGWAYGESDELKKTPKKTVPPLSFPDSLLFLLRCLPSSFTTCKTLKSLDPKIWTLIKLFNVENSLISILSDVSLCADQMVYQVQEISQFLSGKRKKERKPNKASINATQLLRRCFSGFSYIPRTKSERIKAHLLFYVGFRNHFGMFCWNWDRKWKYTAACMNLSFRGAVNCMLVKGQTSQHLKNTWIFLWVSSLQIIWPLGHLISSG